MLEIIIVLAIYSALILFFVPLTKIGKAQDWVKAKVKKVQDKIEEE